MDTRNEIAKKELEEKEYRTKLYQENKKLYKKEKAGFGNCEDYEQVVQADCYYLL